MGWLPNFIFININCYSNYFEGSQEKIIFNLSHRTCSGYNRLRKLYGSVPMLSGSFSCLFDVYLGTHKQNAGDISYTALKAKADYVYHY